MVGAPLRQRLLLGGCLLGDAALSFLGSAPRSAALAVAPSLTLRRRGAASSVSGGGGAGIGMIEIVQELGVFGELLLLHPGDFRRQALHFFVPRLDLGLHFGSELRDLPLVRRLHGADALVRVVEELLRDEHAAGGVLRMIMRRARRSFLRLLHKHSASPATNKIMRPAFMASSFDDSPGGVVVGLVVGSILDVGVADGRVVGNRLMITTLVTFV